MLSNRKLAGARRFLGFTLVLGACAWSARPVMASGEEGEDSWSHSRAARSSANDLRILVELRFSNYSPAIDDTEGVRIQVFRSGLLHYEQVRGFTRTAAPLTASASGRRPGPSSRTWKPLSRGRGSGSRPETAP